MYEFYFPSIFFGDSHGTSFPSCSPRHSDRCRKVLSVPRSIATWFSGQSLSGPADHLLPWYHREFWNGIGNLIGSSREIHSNFNTISVQPFFRWKVDTVEQWVVAPSKPVTFQWELSSTHTIRIPLCKLVVFRALGIGGIVYLAGVFKKYQSFRKLRLSDIEVRSTFAQSNLGFFWIYVTSVENN